MIQQWLNIPSSDILVVLSQWGGSNRGGFRIITSNSKGFIQLDGMFNIISYDIVPKLQNILMESEFKVVIADESHFLKNAQAKRTSASLPILQKAQYVTLLSGTPALSRPIELFKQLEALYPDVYKNVHEYGNRYCKGGIFGVYQGASNHEELHNLMKATVMIRRLKKDVLSELPVKRRQQVFFDLAEKDMRQINALFRELEVVKSKIKASQSKEEAESLKLSEKNLINRIYIDSAEAKIPAVVDYLVNVIESGCKFLIFAHHKPMVDAIYQFLQKKKVGCIRIDGSTPAAARQTLVTDFQEKDSIKAAVLSIKAGGVGVTLTAASTVIFAELSWTPGDMIQAEDRAHRIGQVSSVNVYYLLANDTVDDIIWDVVQSKLENLGQSPYSSRNSSRGIFCSRTLNLRSISAIGYDMDYTLMHYNVMAWEGRAYDYCMDNLKNMGFPVAGLSFDPDLVIRGLVIDKEKGNLVKADRFGYVKRAMHGTRMLSNQAVSEMYGRELVDLRKENRWEFLNTLFSVSEAVAYMQMVDRLDEGAIAPDLGPLDYKGLYKAVGKALFRAHVEGQLKNEIMSKPELFVEPDPELPLALLDQKEAGKRLLLITNSDYHYTDKMMKHSFNRFLPNDMGWRDLFDMVIVSARKPEFFQMSHPMYEVVTGEGLMRPCFKARPGGLYSGGSAQMIENSLNIHGDEILYVGDHIYTDVSQSKVHLRWRTALICRELEEEDSALIRSRGHRAALIELINQKEVVGDLFNQLRLALQRRTKARPAQTLAATNMDDQELTESMQKLLIVMQRLDHKIAPMLEADGEHFNKRWGFLSRAGLWDKSHLMRQIEKYADIYTSRVSNFLHYTPFMYFRSQEQTLAHDSYSYQHSELNKSSDDNCGKSSV